MIRILLAIVAAMLLLGGATAHAASTTFISSDYYTSYQVPEAPGTMQYGDQGTTFGGLCAPTGTVPVFPLKGTGLCPDTQPVNPPLNSVDLVGGTASSSGLIEFTLPGVGVDGLMAGQSWLMTISVQGYSGARTGDIYEVTQCSGPCTTNSTFTPVLTTDAVCLASAPNSPCTNTSYSSAETTGAASEAESAGSTITIGITDLLEQYIANTNSCTSNPPTVVCSPHSTTDNLPGLVPQGNANLNGGTVSSGYDTDILLFTVTITPTPEPASLALLGGAIALLGAARRRGRSLLARAG